MSTAVSKKFGTYRGGRCDRRREIVPAAPGIVLLATLLFCGTAGSEEPRVELQERYGHYYTTYRVNADGTAVETREWSRTALKKEAVAWVKSASVSYSTSAQRGEVLEAYTRKADGRRIPVPKDNYQVEINRGKGRSSPLYSDETTLTVVFPEVEVGDSIVFKYRLTQTEPLFPGHFSTTEWFYKTLAHDDVRVRIEYPETLWVQYEARGLQSKPAVTKDGWRVLEWTYANPNPVKQERRNYSVFHSDDETGYAFSTFRTYAEIAAAYGQRATPKAAVTDRIRALAAEIVKDEKDPRAQTRALYEWVATNVTYAGNCIGIGAVVPRDLPFVLDNRIGDCKDHATLLQALLAARDIESIQALVNAGAEYRLPKIPVVSAVNHVINYLPGLDLFVDSTSDSTPFGMLPAGDRGKPVLLVSGFRDGMVTPVPPPEANSQTVRSVLTIDDKGSVTGFVEIHQTGDPAVGARAWARKLTREWEEEFVRNLFRSRGLVGFGTLTKDDASALADRYRYRVDMTAEKFVRFPGAGAFYLTPPGNLAGSIQNFFTYAMNAEKNADITCNSGSVSEEYEVTLPRGMKVLYVPENMKRENGFLKYEARYRLKGNVLYVQRTMTDRTPGNICSPEHYAAYTKFGEPVMDNLKSPVLYK